MTWFALCLIAMGFAVGYLTAYALMRAAMVVAPTDWRCCQQALAHLHAKHQAEMAERGRR